MDTNFTTSPSSKYKSSSQSRIESRLSPLATTQDIEHDNSAQLFHGQISLSTVALKQNFVVWKKTTAGVTPAGVFTH